MKKLLLLGVFACLLLSALPAFAQVQERKFTFTSNNTLLNPNFHLKGQEIVVRGRIIGTKDVGSRGNCNIYAHNYTNGFSKYLLITEIVYDGKDLLEVSKWYFFVPEIDLSATKNTQGEVVIKMKQFTRCVNIDTSYILADDSATSHDDYTIQFAPSDADAFIEYLKKLKQ